MYAFVHPLLHFRSELIRFNIYEKCLYLSIFQFLTYFGTTCDIILTTLKPKKLQES